MHSHTQTISRAKKVQRGREQKSTIHSPESKTKNRSKVHNRKKAEEHERQRQGSKNLESSRVPNAENQKQTYSLGVWVQAEPGQTDRGPNPAESNKAVSGWRVRQRSRVRQVVYMGVVTMTV